MKTAEEIAEAIQQLAPAELARFRVWFDEYEANRFDTAIEQDVLAGRLDRLADDALAEFTNCKTSWRS